MLNEAGLAEPLRVENAALACVAHGAATHGAVGTHGEASQVLARAVFDEVHLFEEPDTETLDAVALDVVFLSYTANAADKVVVFGGRSSFGLHYMNKDNTPKYTQKQGQLEALCYSCDK